MAEQKDIEGDERYTFTDLDNGVIHKVDTKGQPDLDGMEFHLVEEMQNGYTVYMKQGDPSQPNANYFIHKKYFVGELPEAPAPSNQGNYR